MPFMTMKCKDCGEQFEYFQRTVTSEIKPECKCGSVNAERVFNSMPSVNLVKGSGGFHSRDYEDPRKKMEYLASDP